MPAQKEEEQDWNWRKKEEGHSTAQGQQRGNMTAFGRDLADPPPSPSTLLRILCCLRLPCSLPTHAVGDNKFLSRWRNQRNKSCRSSRERGGRAAAKDCIDFLAERQGKNWRDFPRANKQTLRVFGTLKMYYSGDSEHSGAFDAFFFSSFFFEPIWPEVTKDNTLLVTCGEAAWS